MAAELYRDLSFSTTKLFFSIGSGQENCPVSLEEGKRQRDDGTGEEGQSIKDSPK